MAFKGISVDIHYAQDPKLSKQDVQQLMEFHKEEPLLPDIDEPLAILFLQKTKYDKDLAKIAIVNYFKHKRNFIKMYRGRHPLNLKEHLDDFLFVTLPKTPEGYSILYVKAFYGEGCQHDVLTTLRYADMVLMLNLIQEGFPKGFIVVVDLQSFSYDFVKQFIKPSVLKTLFDYFQKIIPMEFKGIHYFNLPFHTEEFLTAVRSTLEDPSLLHVHDNVEELAKYVPRTCLPQDYGGLAESEAVLHEKVKNNLLNNTDFFEWEDKQLGGESK